MTLNIIQASADPKLTFHLINTYKFINDIFRPYILTLLLSTVAHFCRREKRNEKTKNTVYSPRCLILYCSPKPPISFFSFLLTHQKRIQFLTCSMFHASIFSFALLSIYFSLSFSLCLLLFIFRINFDSICFSPPMKLINPFFSFLVNKYFPPFPVHAEFYISLFPYFGHSFFFWRG